jgi:hypothetical protein
MADQKASAVPIYPAPVGSGDFEKHGTKTAALPRKAAPGAPGLLRFLQCRARPELQFLQCAP